MGAYYDGTKLLSMLHINGRKPEIYMCTTNRTGGKTTYFGRLCVNRFLKENINVASLKYSVFPYHYPVQELEINESINILRKYSKKIFLLGFSAGAHLSLLAYTNENNKDVKGMIALYPVVSFKEYVHEGSRDHFLNYETNEDNIKKYSIENVRKELNEIYREI